MFHLAITTSPSNTSVVPMIFDQVIGSPNSNTEEIITAISGVEFETCYARRVSADIDGVPVTIIGLEDLKTNKKACGRHKDLDDLEKLP